MKRELAESMWKMGVSSWRELCPIQRALESLRLSREALRDCRSLRLRCCWTVYDFGIFNYLDIGNHKENLVIWILLCAFAWFSLLKLMIVLIVFKQICCFSFDLPWLFLSFSSSFCNSAGGVMVFFMFIVLALPLNTPQMFAEGLFTLKHSSPSFSFYSPLPCYIFPSLSSNNIFPKDQVEKQFIVCVIYVCVYMYNAHTHAYVVHMYSHRVCIYIYIYIYAKYSRCRIASNAV